MPRGFQVVEVGDADSRNYAQTVVFYQKGKEAEAKLVAGLYSAQTKPVPSTIRAQGDAVLVMGRNAGTPSLAKTSPSLGAPPSDSTPAAQSAPKALIHAC